MSRSATVERSAGRAAEPTVSGGPSEALLAVGPLPPPYHGVATAMEQVVGLRDRHAIPVVVLDTADRRSLDNVGVLDFTNVWLALRHGAEFLWLLLRRRPAVISVYVSQGKLAFLRDFLFFAPARLTGRRLIVHLQGGYFRQFYDESPGWLRWMIRWSLAGADRVIVLGERFRHFFEGIVPAERVAVLPNAIDPRPFDEARAARRAPAPETRRPRVLYLATITAEKGALDLLRAAAAIRSEVPDVEIVFHGEPERKDEREIQAIIERDRLEGTVRFGGVVSGALKLDAFLESDVFVFPSRYPYEGHPFVILEAMAAGLPIVTTDHATIPDTVLDGENGLIVDKSDSAAIARATARLLKDAELRARMGEANRRRLLEHYSLEGWQSRFATLVRDVLAER